MRGGSRLALCCRTLAIALLLVVEASGATIPPMEIHADPAERDAAAHLESLPSTVFDPAIVLTGSRSHDPVRVFVAGEQSRVARSTPSWISGFADGRASTIVVFPARASSYPNDGLDELIRHEMSHVLTARAARGGDVPRWFDEGVAMNAGRGWSFDDRSRLTFAMVTGSPIGMDEVDRAFLRGEVPAGRAYAISEAFVRDLLKRHGPGVTAAILAEVGRGRSFPAAFRNATGESLAQAERTFWSDLTFWNRWLPIITSSFVLWIAITLLALWAIGRRRARDAAIRARWEEEDWLEAEAERRRREDEDSGPWVM